ARADDFADDLERFARDSGRRVAVLAGLVVLGLGAVGSAWALWPTSAGVATTGLQAGVVSPGPAREGKPFLTVRGWREQQVHNGLTAQVPLHRGDAIEVRAMLPAGLHAALFEVNGEGELRQLAAGPPQAETYQFVYPGGGVMPPLQGPSGTELLLLCGRRAGPIHVGDLHRLWGAEAGWPELPPQSVVRLDRDQVEPEERVRDVGTPQKVLDPEGAVLDRLDAFRRQLAVHFDYVAGVAFRYQE